MHEQRNPSDIAREALKRLAARHLAPTPANFQACYNEIADLPDTAPFPEVPLRQLTAALVPHGERQRSALAACEAAIAGRSWQGVQSALIDFVEQGGAQHGDDRLSPSVAAAFGRLLDCILPVFGNEDQRLNEAAGAVRAALRLPVCSAASLRPLVDRLVTQAGFAVEELLEIHQLLLRLLHLIIENIGELTNEDNWLKGQIDGLLAAVEPPLTLRHLDEMERRLRDVMDKQSQAHARSVEAQEELRQMLAAFIERLGSINETSASFETQVEEGAARLDQVTSIEDIRPLLGGIAAAAHRMADETAQSREQLQSLQDRVLATEAELVQLHLELDNASALARHDPLTDALNRKGLDEALAREIAAMRRRETPLAISMLDIDNFKKLNDRLGHEAGDDALVHLADIARRCMRPTDTLARYGGEEFVILMPDTLIEQGVEAMVRLQRELTRAFFTAGKEKVLITFSAGVVQLAADESGSDAVRRADRAMYLAKRAGKNRVVGG